ncbi:MAG: hypothetical protein ABI634_12890 [Acidobacteriota bacterium]
MSAATSNTEVSDVVSPTELMQRLGIKKSQFFALQKQGAFRMFEFSRPIGSRRYARVLVDRYFTGESVGQFGRRRAS